MVFRLFILFALFITTTFGQDLDYTHTVINKLTSEKFYGRGYVKHGDKIAANYLVDEFKAIGLLPLGNSYFQRFSFPVNTFPKKINLAINGKLLIPGKDFLVHAGSPSIKMNGIRAKNGIMQNVNNVLEIDSIDHSTEHIKKNLFLKLHTAKQNLHVQIIDKKLTWTVSTQAIDTAQIQILSSSLLQEIQTIDVAITNKFLANHETQNVIGIIQGSNNVDSFMVITAHYDQLGMMGNKTIFPGANDNASGISMLLNLANYFSKPENKLPYNLVFICFAGEEAGLLGSKFFTDHPLIELKKIRFLINLDLLGTGDEGMMVVNAEIHPKAFQVLDSINTANNYLPLLGKRGKAKNSDHYYFTENGVPAFFCYTLGGINAYHDIYDVASTLPLTRYKETFGLLKDFIIRY
jgi:hypothetical protein